MDEDCVVILKIEPEVVDEPLWLFRGRPGFPNQPIQICPEHGAGVVEGEEGIEPELLELPLTGDRPPGSGVSDVVHRSKMLSDKSRVVRVLIGFDRGLRVDHGSEPLKHSIPSKRTCVFSLPVFAARGFRESPLGGHPTDLEVDDFTSLFVDRQGNAEGFEFGVFEGLEIIELEFVDRAKTQLPESRFMLSAGPRGHHAEFSDDGLWIGPEVERHPALAHA